MSNTETKPKSNEKVQDQPLTVREHLDPDKHWIGETLAPPTQSEIAATVGITSGPGDSPFVARADHTHRLEAGLRPTYIFYTPSGVINATTSSSIVTWLTTSASLVVPSWATAVLLDINLTGIYMVTSATDTNYYLYATVLGGTYPGYFAVFQASAINIRSSISFTSYIATSPGTRDIRVGAARAAGTGVLRADTASPCHFIVSYY